MITHSKIILFGVVLLVAVSEAHGASKPAASPTGPAHKEFVQSAQVSSLVSISNRAIAGF